jgi:hypothetical protein
MEVWLKQQSTCFAYTTPWAQIPIPSPTKKCIPFLINVTPSLYKCIHTDVKIYIYKYKNTYTLLNLRQMQEGRGGKGSCTAHSLTRRMGMLKPETLNSTPPRSHKSLCPRASKLHIAHTSYLWLPVGCHPSFPVCLNTWLWSCGCLPASTWSYIGGWGPCFPSARR